MTTLSRDECPCGCKGDVPLPTGLGDTPFVSVDSVKVYLATATCRTRYEEKQPDTNIVMLQLAHVKDSIEKTS